MEFRCYQVYKPEAGINDNLSGPVFDPSGIKWNKKIAVVPEKQIEDIRTFLESGLPVSASTDTFAKGEQVVINFGPLKGYQGELLEIENEKHFIVRIAVINQILRLSVPKAYLEKV